MTAPHQVGVAGTLEIRAIPAGLQRRAPKGVLDLSDAADDATVDEQIEQLLAIGGKTRDEIDEVGILAQPILLR